LATRKSINMKKFRLSKIVGILLIILGAIGFIISLIAALDQQTLLFVTGNEVPLNNTNSSGLAAIASGIIIFVGGRLLEEHKK
jgi:hypothetical protein